MFGMPMPAIHSMEVTVTPNQTMLLCGGISICILWFALVLILREIKKKQPYVADKSLNLQKDAAREASDIYQEMLVIMIQHLIDRPMTQLAFERIVELGERTISIRRKPNGGEVFSFVLVKDDTTGRLLNVLPNE